MRCCQNTSTTSLQTRLHDANTATASCTACERFLHSTSPPANIGSTMNALSSGSHPTRTLNPSATAAANSTTTLAGPVALSAVFEIAIQIHNYPTSESLSLVPKSKPNSFESRTGSDNRLFPGVSSLWSQRPF